MDNDSVILQCAKCGGLCKAPRHYVGRTFPCPNCKEPAEFSLYSPPSDPPESNPFSSDVLPLVWEANPASAKAAGLFFLCGTIFLATALTPVLLSHMFGYDLFKAVSFSAGTSVQFHTGGLYVPVSLGLILLMCFTNTWLLVAGISRLIRPGNDASSAAAGSRVIRCPAVVLRIHCCGIVLLFLGELITGLVLLVKGGVYAGSIVLVEGFIVSMILAFGACLFQRASDISARRLPDKTSLRYKACDAVCFLLLAGGELFRYGMMWLFAAIVIHASEGDLMLVVYILTFVMTVLLYLSETMGGLQELLYTFPQVRFGLIALAIILILLFLLFPILLVFVIFVYYVLLLFGLMTAGLILPGTILQSLRHGWRMVCKEDVAIDVSVADRLEGIRRWPGLVFGGILVGMVLLAVLVLWTEDISVKPNLLAVAILSVPLVPLVLFLLGLAKLGELVGDFEGACLSVREHYERVFRS